MRRTPFATPYLAPPPRFPRRGYRDHSHRRRCLRARSRRTLPRPGRRSRCGWCGSRYRGCRHPPPTRFHGRYRSRSAARLLGRFDRDPRKEDWSAPRQRGPPHRARCRHPGILPKSLDNGRREPAGEPLERVPVTKVRPETVALTHLSDRAIDIFYRLLHDDDVGAIDVLPARDLTKERRNRGLGRGDVGG